MFRLFSTYVGCINSCVIQYSGAGWVLIQVRTLLTSAVDGLLVISEAGCQVRVVDLIAVIWSGTVLRADLNVSYELSELIFMWFDLAASSISMCDYSGHIGSCIVRHTSYFCMLIAVVFFNLSGIMWVSSLSVGVFSSIICVTLFSVYFHGVLLRSNILFHCISEISVCSSTIWRGMFKFSYILYSVILEIFFSRQLPVSIFYSVLILFDSYIYRDASILGSGVDCIINSSVVCVGFVSLIISALFLCFAVFLLM